MYRRLTACSLALLLGLSLAACSTPKAQQNQSSENANPEPKTEAVNAKTETVEAAERVVALTSLSADILQRLDRTKLVGIPGTRLFAEDERFEDLPQVSQGRTPPSVEKIIALKPDLVVGAKGFHDQVLEKIQGLGIETKAVEVNSWDTLIEATEELAGAIAADPQPLLKRYATFLEDVPTQSPLTLAIVSTQPILAPNKNSWAGDLLTKFNATNLVADLQGKSEFQGYVTLSPEKVLKENPELVLIVDPGGEGVLEKLQSQSFWKDLKATKKEQIYTFDYYGLVNPGSIDKIEEACLKLKKALSASS